ncbi:MAG: tRNA lysidine(34) synthetase TilS [Proteobacteria bacterium]|nr:MAG: tRNA lysidine(34) synthetase TilS [Pseudomonadota bacterium]PIE18938.1 MAG: tRNA lysidine(34) synthetase TilS [Pseudomonadota bacterium]
MVSRDTTLVAAVRAACRREGLLSSGDRVLVAFSGGPDSLALLDALSTVGREAGLPTSALHLDHGLRETSAHEAERARDLGAGLGVEVVVRRLVGLDPSPANLEERAREARRAALREHARAWGADAIALGHTADDQAETVLMRLLRGAGSRGLAAMPVYDPPWIRPMLGCRRAEVERHLHMRGLEPIEDPTNRSTVFLRNRVRQAILPLLREENPRIIETLGRLAITAREESEALDSWASQTLGELRVGEGLEVGPLLEAPIGLVHRVLALLYASSIGDLRRVRRQHLEALVELCRRPHGVAQLDLPGSTAIREYGTLRIQPKGGADRSPCQGIQVFEIKGPGSWPLVPGERLEACVGHAGGPEPLALPLRRVELPLWVRGPQPGDRLCIECIGRRRHRRVSRILIDAKIPAGKRNTVPLVLSQEGEVLLLVGVRRAAGLHCRAGEPVLWFRRNLK